MRVYDVVGSKRQGTSAEPQYFRIDLNAAEYSFMVMVSNAVNGRSTKQEIVDAVKESRTPAQGAVDLVEFAVEVAAEAGTATALVMRLGGWEGGMKVVVARWARMSRVSP
ncbi:Protein phosphatase 2C 6, partial [Elasticomyces elasticus]